MYIDLVYLNKQLPLSFTSFPNYRLIIILTIYAVAFVFGATENVAEIIINI